MNTIITVIGIFAGIGIFLAAMYSMTQILLLERWARVAHAANFALILMMMGSLYFYRSVPAARMFAVPLIVAAFWTLIYEPRWYRVFPLIVMFFAMLMILGYVAITPVGPRG